MNGDFLGLLVRLSLLSVQVLDQVHVVVDALAAELVLWALVRLVQASFSRGIVLQHRPILHDHVQLPHCVPSDLAEEIFGSQAHFPFFDARRVHFLLVILFSLGPLKCYFLLAFSLSGNLLLVLGVLCILALDLLLHHGCILIAEYLLLYFLLLVEHLLGWCVNPRKGTPKSVVALELLVQFLLVLNSCRNLLLQVIYLILDLPFKQFIITGRLLFGCDCDVELIQQRVSYMLPLHELLLLLVDHVLGQPFFDALDGGGAGLLLPAFEGLVLLLTGQRLRWVHREEYVMLSGLGNHPSDLLLVVIFIVAIFLSDMNHRR